MRLILSVIIILYLPVLFSCKKNNSHSSNTPTDTLPTGWKKITLAEPAQLVDIFFIGSAGFTISSNAIFKSTDGGVNWSKIPFAGTSFINLGMGSEMNAVFVHNPNKLISTHNGGASFDTVTVADDNLMDVFFVSATTAYAAGKSIWKTIDGGYSWTKLHDFSVSIGYKSLHFLNDQTGWVVRADGLYKTTNGGIDWQIVTTPTFDFSVDCNVFFLNSTSGYISDEYSVGRSTNSGVSWNKTFNGLSAYHDIHFITDNIGYVTDRTHVYKTTDGGNTWTKEVGLVSNQIFELHFTDLNHGWACGDGGTVLRFNP